MLIVKELIHHISMPCSFGVCTAIKLPQISVIQLKPINRNHSAVFLCLQSINLQFDLVKLRLRALLN